MSIYANTVIQDALALIDVVAPGEAADEWWGQLGVRMLNGLLKEWANKGYYNPKLSFYEFSPTENSKNYYTVGINDNLKTLSNIKYSIVETLSPTGTYYKSVNTINDEDYVKYSTTGTGSTYSLVVTEDTAGTFYQINGGYAQKEVGDIPVDFANIMSVQVDLGTVVYTPRIVSLEEYLSISVKQTQSTPMVFAYDFQKPIGKLYFWPKLLGNLKIRVIGQPTIEAVSNIQSTIELDESLYTAILFNLAAKLYPFLKREAGIDKEIIYQAKTAVESLRSKMMIARSRHVAVPYAGQNRPSADYWTSPLNTVNR